MHSCLIRYGIEYSYALLFSKQMITEIITSGSGWTDRSIMFVPSNTENVSRVVASTLYHLREEARFCYGIVCRTCCHQLERGSHLNNFSLVHDYHQVVVCDGVQPMRNGNDGVLSEALFESLLV